MLLQAYLNGSRAPHEHARLPLTADGIAADAAACVAAGAAALHAHPRHSSGEESLHASACLRVLVEVETEDDAAAAVAQARQIDAVLDDGLVEAPRLHHGNGVATWSVMDAAMEAGHDVRIGLEDTLVNPDGSTVEGNAALVAAAAARARGMGRTLNAVRRG